MKIDNNNIEYYWEPSNEYGEKLLTDIAIPCSGEKDIKMTDIKVDMKLIKYKQNYHGSFVKDKVTLSMNIKLHLDRRGWDNRTRNWTYSYHEDFNVAVDYSIDDLKNAMNHLLVYMKDKWSKSIDNIYNSDIRPADLLKDALIYEHIQ